MSKSDNVYMTTPWGQARYPSLNEPDTRGQFATGKFITGLKLDPKDYANFKALFDTEVKGMGIRGPIKTPFKLTNDGEGFIRATSKFKPQGFDTKNNPLPAGVAVGGGSILRMRVQLWPYKGGVSFQIISYQVKDLKVWQRSASFDDVDDGFTIDDLDSDDVSFDDSDNYPHGGGAGTLDI